MADQTNAGARGRTDGIQTLLDIYRQETEQSPGVRSLVQQVEEELAALLATVERQDAELSRLRAVVEEQRKASAGVLLAFHDWPMFTGSERSNGERRNALNALAEVLATATPEGTH